MILKQLRDNAIAYSKLLPYLSPDEETRREQVKRLYANGWDINQSLAIAQNLLEIQKVS